MKTLRQCWLLLLTFSLGAELAAQPPGASAQKFTQSHSGMVATGSSYATQAGTRMMEAGGNAIDAAAAAWFALIVTDPANTSLGGRAQILLRLRDGQVIALDGATEAPAGVLPLRGAGDTRSGYAVAPIPGGLAAVATMQRQYGRLRLAEVMRPAIELAENGFVVPPRLAAAWRQTRAALARNPGAAQNFLKPDGSAWQAGETFHQPNLARVLAQVAEQGVRVFYRGELADVMTRDVAAHGGFWLREDLLRYRAQPGVVVRSVYRGHHVVSAGGRAWGNTLSEMLNILSHFKLSQSEPTTDEIELLARVIAQALADRPQELGTLKPKPGGYPLRLLSSPAFATQRARMIRQKLRPASSNTPSNKPLGKNEEPGDTTHLSVMDAAGNAVSLTTSIGPAFGARVATPELGFLYAHSYRMRSAPQPRERDLTEMTPTIVFKGGQPLLAVGAAGSERIPSAILQVISNALDRRWTLERAMRAPRIFCVEQKLRLNEGFAPATIEALRDRGFEIEIVLPDASRHQGLAHAVQYDPVTKTYFGAADLGDSGSASAPTANRDKR
ncbi:MAG: gamma-glutamyltransferase family protein [Blastocatellales bacterium]